MSRLRLALLGLLIGLALSACSGAATAASWPGLATNGELVFVAYNNQVTAVNLADGKRRWAFPPSPGGSSDQFAADPGVSADVLVVGSEGPLASHSGALFGLDPQDGSQKWCLAFDSRARDRLSTPTAPCPMVPDGTEAGPFGLMPPEDNRLLSGIALADGMAYFGTGNNKVYAVDALTGQLQWPEPFVTRHPIWAAPLVDRDAVYIASLDHFLYALNRADGALKWSKDLGTSLAGTPALVDGTLYVGTFGKRLYALEAASGDEKWTFDQASSWIWGGPIVRDGTLYFTDLGGGLFAVNAQTGARQWTATPGGVLRGTPAILGDLLFIGDKDGKLFARRLADGSDAWSQAVSGGGQLLASPLVIPDKELVLVAPLQGSNLLVAYTTTGALKWAFAPGQ